jgi:hypothetical protein
MQQSISQKMKGSSLKDEKNLERQRLEEMLRENDIRPEQEDANQINFKQLFQESLPPAAMDLIKMKEDLEKDKDSKKQVEIDFKVKTAQDNLYKARNMIPEGQMVSAKMMASEFVID